MSKSSQSKSRSRTRSRSKNHHSPDKKSPKIFGMFVKTFAFEEYDRFKDLFDDLEKIELRENKPLVLALESMKKYEPHIFNVDSAYKLILGYMYLTTNKNQEQNQEALNAVKEVLKNDKDNLIALSLNREFCQRMQYRHDARDLRKQINKVKDSQENVDIAKATIFIYLSKLDPSFNVAAKYVLEGIIQSNRDVTKLKFYRYYLLQIYGRLLKQYFTVYNSLPETDPAEIFTKMKTIIKQVEGHPFLYPRALADITSSFERYELISSPTEQRQALPFNWTKRQCYVIACINARDPSHRRLAHYINKMPSPPIYCVKNSDLKHVERECLNCIDAHVLEKFGIHLKKISSSIKDLEFAKTVLDRVIELSPERHIAFHHLALLHRNLWWFDDDLSQRCLITNSVKSGYVKKSTGINKNKRRRDRKKQDPRRSQTSLGLTSSYEVSHRELLDFIRNPSQTKLLLKRKNKMKKGKHKIDTIFPNQPTPLGEIPNQYTKIDYFDNLRSKNPAASKRKNLNLAKTFMEKANDLVDHKRLIYLIDLARVCISLQSYDAAEHYFSLADSHEVSKSFQDQAYLYEQWGLLKWLLIQNKRNLTDNNGEHENDDASSERSESESEDQESNDSDSDISCSTSKSSESEEDPASEDSRYLDDIERLLFKSLKYSIQAKKKSRVAFYALRDVLELELKQIQLEVTKRSVARLVTLVWIYKEVGKSKEADKIIDKFKSLNINTSSVDMNLAVEVHCFGLDWENALATLMCDVNINSDIGETHDHASSGVPKRQIVTHRKHDIGYNCVKDRITESREDAFEPWKELYLSFFNIGGKANKIFLVCDHKSEFVCSICDCVYHCLGHTGMTLISMDPEDFDDTPIDKNPFSHADKILQQTSLVLICITSQSVDEKMIDFISKALDKVSERGSKYLGSYLITENHDCDVSELDLHRLRLINMSFLNDMDKGCDHTSRSVSRSANGRNTCEEPSSFGISESDAQKEAKANITNKVLKTLFGAVSDYLCELDE